MNALMLRELLTRGLVLAKRVPVIVWAGLFVALLIVVAAVSLVHYGARRERQTQQREAHRAAVAVATQHVNAAAAHTDALIARADATKPAVATATKVRRAVRERVVIVDSATVRIDGELTAAPPVLIALISADDEKIRADSVHVAPLEVLPVAVLEERSARVQLDSAETVAAADRVPEPGTGGHTKLVAGGLAALGILLALLHH